MGGTPLDDARMYTLATSDFLVSRGGDGYTFPQGREASRPGSELVYLVLDAIINAQAEGRAHEVADRVGIVASAVVEVCRQRAGCRIAMANFDETFQSIYKTVHDAVRS